MRSLFALIERISLLEYITFCIWLHSNMRKIKQNMVSPNSFRELGKYKKYEQKLCFALFYVLSASINIFVMSARNVFTHVVIQTEREREKQIHPNQNCVNLISGMKKLFWATRVTKTNTIILQYCILRQDSASIHPRMRIIWPKYV